MPDKKLFDAVNKNVNKFEIRLENYIVPILQANAIPVHRIHNDNEDVQEATETVKNMEETSEERIAAIRNAVIDKYAVFADKQDSKPPKLCMWHYMSEKEVENLLNTSCKESIRKIVDDKMKAEYPKGISRLLAVELMYSIVRFCQKCNFNLAQSGSLLSIFYLTHEYFLSSFYTSAESTYHHFKEYMLLHCFECPPDSMKLFSYKESTHVVRYFCSIYLRNLPLIRLLALPNFGFRLNYEILPDPFEEAGKKGKKK